MFNLDAFKLKNPNSSFYCASTNDHILETAQLCTICLKNFCYICALEDNMCPACGQNEMILNSKLNAMINAMIVECSICQEELTFEQAKHHPLSLKAHDIECIGRRKGCLFSDRKNSVLKHQIDCIFAVQVQSEDVSEKELSKHRLLLEKQQKFISTLFNHKQDQVIILALNLIDAKRQKRNNTGIDLKLFFDQVREHDMAYKTNIEPALVDRFKKHYLDLANNIFLVDISYSNILKIIENEENMEGIYFLSKTKPVISKYLTDIFIRAHVDHLQNLFFTVLKTTNEKELRALYTLLLRCPELISLFGANFGSYISETLLPTFVEKHYFEQNFCANLIHLKHQYCKLIERCFANDISFSKSLNLAFSKFCNDEDLHNNRGIKKICCRLANFIHRLISKRNIVRSKIEFFLTESVALVDANFNFENKKLFQSCLKQRLSQRLLSDEFDFDLETFCLTTLERQFAINQFRHMRQMLNDVNPEKLKCLRREFEEYVALKNIDLEFSFSISVLKRSHWPSLKFEDSRIKFVSAQMEKAHSCLTEYIKGMETKKRVDNTWHYGAVEVETSYMRQEGGVTSNINFIVSPLQAQLLLLFNKNEKMTGSQILSRLSSESLLSRDFVGIAFAGLSPLVYGSYCPIGINSNDVIERTLTREDEFYLKDSIDCHSPVVKFKSISTFQIEKQSTINNCIDAYIKKRRQFKMDSAIIKVVMSHGEIDATRLYTEVQKKLANEWMVTVEHIKERIPLIIERDYIKRSEHDANLLIYVR